MTTTSLTTTPTTLRNKLTRREVRWAEAAFGTIFPPLPEQGFELGIVDMNVEQFVDETRARSPAITAFGIRFAIWFAALSPLFVIGRFATLAGLSQDDRERVMSALMMSPIYLVRQMVLILKATGALLYGGHPAIRARCHAGTGEAATKALASSGLVKLHARAPTRAA